MISHSEEVLCSRTKDLPSSWLPASGIVPISEQELWKHLQGSIPVWLKRSHAESDPDFKQWIPYVLVRRADGAVGTYERRGSEKRLSERWSIGIGGHVNRVDSTSDSSDPTTQWRSTLWNGLRRELAEEYPGATTGVTRFLGLVHESLTPVGRVHLGMVFVHEPDVIEGMPGAELSGFQWISPALIGSKEWPIQRFETWSQLASKFLD